MVVLWRTPYETFIYTTNTGYIGVDVFTYEICNAYSSVCLWSTVNVTIIAPLKANDDSEESYVDVLVTIPIISNDTDDYESHTTKKLTDPSNGSILKDP